MPRLRCCSGFPRFQRAGLLSACGGRASHLGGFSCSQPPLQPTTGGSLAANLGGFSCCQPRAPGVWAAAVAAHGLRIVSPGLSSTASVAVVRGLSCSKACGIFLDQGSCPLHWQANSSPLSHQGRPHFLIIRDSFDFL